MVAERIRLSKRAVDAAPVPGQGEARLWDDALAGFCLRVYAPTPRAIAEAYAAGRPPRARKVYAVKYRVGRTQRWFTIGPHGSPWTPDTAREKAAAVLRDASGGVDHQTAKLARRADLSVGELIDAYLKDGPAAKPAKRASSWAQDRSGLERHARPLLGAKVARDVTKADVQGMARAIVEGETAADVKTKKRGRAIIRGGAGVAERTLATVSAMYAWAIEGGEIAPINGLALSNPARGVRLARRAIKERFLSSAEAAGLMATLDAMQADKGLDPGHADIFRMLLLSGARRTEISALRWAEVDLPRNRLVLPPERSKAGGKTGERRIALGSAARAILDRRHAARSKGAAYVFPALRGAQGPTVGLQRAWERVRKRAPLPGVRIHDLRHTYASFAIADGASLYLVGKALGHADSRVTERYAHIRGDALDELAEAAGRRIAGEDASDEG